MLNTSKEKTYDDITNIHNKLLIPLEHLVFGLTEENLDITVEKTIQLFDSNYPYTYNLIISRLIYYATTLKNIDMYLNYLEIIQIKEEEINKNTPKIIQIFLNSISRISAPECFFLIEKLKKRNLIDSSVHDKLIKKHLINQNNYKDPLSLCFAHYISDNVLKECIEKIHIASSFQTMKKILKKNNWELHKKLIEEGHNPNEIAKIIRNDEIEKLQEISSQTNFNFNQTIEPSLYERCSFINKKNVTFIDYAAFFGSIKCFKYLLMNGANIKNTGKYAVAGGNEEIIHLCEQNHSSFEGVYETAIEFHRNDIFKYLCDKKFEIDLIKLGNLCASYHNYEILLFLIKEGMEINDNIINDAARIGNIYLTKLFLKENSIPKNILVFSSLSRNIELVEYILKQEGINAKNIYLFYFMCILIILDIKIIFENYLNYIKQHLSIHLNMVIQKLLNYFLNKKKLRLMLKIFICFD